MIVGYINVFLRSVNIISIISKLRYSNTSPCSMPFCGSNFIINFLKEYYGGEIQASCINYCFTKILSCACIAELSVMLLDTYAGSSIPA